MRKQFIAAAAALMLSLAGCAGGNGAGSASASADPDATVAIGFLLEPTGLNPTSVAGAAVDQVLVDNVYEGLTRISDDGQVQPLLAKSWEVSKDGLTYTFHLQEGVKFHDGSDFDAQDVVSSLTNAAAPNSLNPDAKLLSAFKSAQAVNTHTVTVSLSKRDSTFLETLARRGGLIIPSDNKVDLAKKDNGTGPYTLGKWTTGSSIELNRFDGYWGQPAKNKVALFRYYKDQTTAANALSSGELDIYTQFDSDLIKRFQNDPNVTTTEGTDQAWMTLAYNDAQPQLADQRVREALREGVDKDGLLKVLDSAYERIGSMSNSGDPWNDDSLLKIDAYNPDHARQLLKEAGAEGLTLTLKVPTVYSPSIAEYIRSQLAKIGVTVNIQSMEFASWLTDVYQNRNFDMTMVLHTDPWTLTYYANPNYYWGYNSQTVQAAVTDALEAASTEERNTKLNKVAHLVSEDAASDWLYSPKAVTFSVAGVSGFPVNRTTAFYPAAGIEVAR